MNYPIRYNRKSMRDSNDENYAQASPSPERTNQYGWVAGFENFDTNSTYAGLGELEQGGNYARSGVQYTTHERSQRIIPQPTQALFRAQFIISALTPCPTLGKT